MNLPIKTSFKSASGLHTILGAGGVIGRELSIALSREGCRVRQVGRHPKSVVLGDDLVTADLCNAEAVNTAVAGSDVVYLVVGITYSAAAWSAQWPIVMRNAINACSRHGARLVYFDNVYAYGHVNGAMTEETPFNPCSRKGEVRASVATTLLEAMARQEISGLIARSADFYGPGANSSFLESVLFSRLRTGKQPQWLGDPDATHTFSFTPDIGRALALLGQSPDAFGQTWHLPTAREYSKYEAVTGRILSRNACTLASQSVRLQVAPSWLLAVMSWFSPGLRENKEVMYQLEHPYLFDSSKIRDSLGLLPTQYSDGLAQTIVSSKIHQK